MTTPVGHRHLGARRGADRTQRSSCAGFRRGAPILMVAALLLGACSSDDGSTASSTTAEAGAGGTTSTSTTSAGGNTPTTGDAPSTFPGLDPSIRERTIEVLISLADGTSTDATFDALEAGPDDGELVLLLHGFPQAAYEWRHQLAALGEAGYHAVAFDQRGYSAGARPAADDDYAITLLAGDVLAVADALDAPSFHLVGHDWGAAVAWVLAGLKPDRVRTLSAVSVPHPAAYSAALQDSEGEQSQKAGYIEVFRDPATPARVTADGGTAFLAAALGTSASPGEVAVYADVLGTEEAMSAALAWYRATDISNGGALPPTTVPTLYVWSDGDCCLGRDAAEATGDHVDAPYTYEVLEGISHWVPEEAAEALTELLLEHLA